MTPNNDTPWWDPDAHPEEKETPWWDQTSQAAPTEPAPERPRRLTLLNAIQAWLAQNHHTALYMTVGFIIALGILLFGFWKTFLVVILVGAGYIYGSWRDGNPRLLAHIRRFYERWINDNPFMK